MWMNQFDVIPGFEMITTISLAWGSVLGGSPPVGKPTIVALYEDPNDDGNPFDAVLLTTETVGVTAPGTDQFTDVPITPTIVSGSFFVAALMQFTDAGEFPIPLDASPPANRSFVASQFPQGAFNLDDLTANLNPPSNIDVNWLLRADGVARPRLIDLLATSFDADADHVLSSQTTVTYTIQNNGTDPAAAFEVHIVLSEDDLVGNGDDEVVVGSTVFFSDLAAGASETRTISLQLDRDRLLQIASAADAPLQGIGTLSQEVETLGLVVDVNDTVVETDESNNFNLGSGIDKDDITYFPWDLNGNGLVEPVDAVAAIQQIGSVNARADLDGDGLVMADEALAITQRLGYSRNPDVFEPMAPTGPIVQVPSFSRRRPIPRTPLTTPTTLSRNVTLPLPSAGLSATAFLVIQEKPEPSLPSEALKGETTEITPTNKTGTRVVEEVFSDSDFEEEDELLFGRRRRRR